MKNKTKLNLSNKGLTEQKNLKSKRKNKLRRMSVIFVSLVVAIISLGTFGINKAQAADRIFYDDFESGDFDKWAVTTSGITNSIEYARSGFRSSKVDYGVNSLQGNIANLGGFSPIDEFYISYYIRIGDNYHSPYLGFKWMRLKHGNVDGIQTEFYLNSESWYSSGHSYQTGTGGLDGPNTGYSWSPDFTDRNWHHVEVFGKYNTGGAANGSCRVWFDDVLRLDRTDYTWRTGIYASDIFVAFYMPSNAGDGVHRPVAGDIIYIDDVEIWDGIPDSITCSDYNNNQTDCEANGCNYCEGTCQSESCSVTIRADVDQQNGITSTDAMLTLRNSLGLDMSETAWQTSATTGDVNCDSNSNSTDAMLILRYSLGLDMNGTAWCE